MRRATGGTGLRVRAIGLGAMPLSIAAPPSAHVARVVIARLLELGGDFIRVSGHDAPVLQAVARHHGCSPHTAARAWLLGKGDHVLAIPGMNRLARVGASFAALRVLLSPDEVAAIDSLAVGATRG